MPPRLHSMYSHYRSQLFRHTAASLNPSHRHGCISALRSASTSKKPLKGSGTGEKSQKTPSPENSSSSSDNDKNPSPISLLNRPLGVQERPTTLRQTWKERTEALMDQDVRLAERQHILKEATKGYFSDLNATRRHGGKTWIAPKVMIREDRALYFPDIEGTSLESGEKVHTTTMCQGKISVIAMLNTKISEIHTAGFASAANKSYLSHPSYQYIQINLQENLLKSFLVSMFLSSLRRTIPQELHSTYLLSRENMEYLRPQLGMMNGHIGYVYLVDEYLRIRWAGCADAMEEEAQALHTAVGVLLDRLGKKGKGSQSKP